MLQSDYMKKTLLLLIAFFITNFTYYAQCNLTQPPVFRGLKLNMSIGEVDKSFEIVNKVAVNTAQIKKGEIIFSDVQYNLRFDNDKLTAFTAIYNKITFTTIKEFTATLTQSLKLPDEWQLLPSITSIKELENNYRYAVVELNFSQKELKRSKELLESGVISKLQVDNAQDRVTYAQKEVDKTNPKLIELIKLKEQKENLQKIYKEKHPEVVSVQNQIDRLTNEINSLFSAKQLLECNGFSMTAYFSNYKPMLDVFVNSKKPFKP
jgi:hypothetical protein